MTNFTFTNQLNLNGNNVTVQMFFTSLTSGWQGSTTDFILAATTNLQTDALNRFNQVRALVCENAIQEIMNRNIPERISDFTFQVNIRNNRIAEGVFRNGQFDTWTFRFDQTNN